MKQYMIGNPVGGYEMNGEDYERYQYDDNTVVTLGPEYEIVAVTENGQRVAPSSRPDVLAAADKPFAAPTRRRLHHVRKLLGERDE